MPASTADVWTAVHALPRPVSVEQVLQAGQGACGDDARARKQWDDWMRVNDETLVGMLNEQQADA